MMSISSEKSHRHHHHPNNTADSFIPSSRSVYKAHTTRKVQTRVVRECHLNSLCVCTQTSTHTRNTHTHNTLIRSFTPLFHYNIKHAQKGSHQSIQWQQKHMPWWLKKCTHTHTKQNQKVMLDESAADDERRQWPTTVADGELWEVQEAGRQAGKSGGCWHF